MQTPRIALVALALGALLPAAYAQVPATPTAPFTTVAQAKHHVAGTVTAAANGSYTVTPRKAGDPVTFTLAPGAAVVQGSPGTMTDIQPGSLVRVDGTVSPDGTSITATRIAVLAALPTRGVKVKPNGKHVVGTVASISPLKVTTSDGTAVTVDTTSAPRVTVLTAASTTALVVGAHVQVTLDKQGAARAVVIMPARQGRRGRKAAAL